jgi:hypothetical protein
VYSVAAHQVHEDSNLVLLFVARGRDHTEELKEYDEVERFPGFEEYYRRKFMEGPGVEASNNNL